MVSKANTTNPKDLLGNKKVPMGAALPVAIAHESLAMLDGELKYGYRNWRSKPVVARIYIDAAKRHLNAWEEMEENAPDSGVHHLGHARACLGILLDAQADWQPYVDDREPGVFTKVTARLEGWVAARRAKHAEQATITPVTNLNLAMVHPEKRTAGGASPQEHSGKHHTAHAEIYSYGRRSND